MSDSENARLLNNVASTGTVLEVDAANKKMRLEIGENQTDWVKIPALAWGALKIWRCPSKGEQFAIISESGNLGNAVPIIAIPTDYDGISGTEDEIIVDFPAGSLLIDQQTGEATFKLKKLTFDVEEVEFTGKVRAQDEISSDKDVKAGSISLKNHKTSGIRSGNEVSGVPQ
ncbi:MULTISPECIES: phage baseplate assembly protein V [unclassified Acinetobacter]|uniref:phage baseplate assembly protein V n=1 Tax=unclassified Acinetobacter TaxID=196816 RepID=UPI0022ABF768|nr:MULTISPECIES: phage baseplate assembly protein V [unclassified Acinetobacter]WAU72950.1 phage baseplate assembly protein V [Acinetobacter sp. TR11]WAU76045.1 phage baseplate assembly protein V [Acinetobacter sp. TR3]